MSSHDVSENEQLEPAVASDEHDEHAALLRPRQISRAASSTIEPPSSAGEEDSAETSRITKLRATCIIAAFSILIFLQSANFTVMSTIQSMIADDLDAYSEVSWFTSTYLIGMSCMSPIFGRLSSIFTPRHCVLVASWIFCAGALIASLADGLPVFLAGRALQGVGSAGILTLSIILVIQLTSKKHRGLFMGATNSAVTVGVSLGAVIGGALGVTLGWRALLWIQCPIALVCGTLVFLSIPISDSDAHARKETLSKQLWALDYSGATLLVLSLVGVLYGLSHPTLQIWPIVAGFVLLVVFVLNEVYRAQIPVIPITVLRSRGALLSCFGQMGFMTVRWAVLFYVPVYAQAVRLWEPARAGALLVPTNAGFAAGGLLAGALHIRRAGSFWLPSVICYTLFPVTVLVLSQISTSDSSTTWYIFTVFANGFIVGAGLNYCLAHMLHLTTPDTHFVATSLLATFRGFSGSFGSALGGGLFTRLLRASLEDGFASHDLKDKEPLIRQLLGKPALVRQLQGIEQEVGRLGYQDATQGLFLAGIGLAAAAIFVQAGTGFNPPTKAKVKADEQEEESFGETPAQP